MRSVFAVCLLALFACAMAADIDSTGQAKLLYVRSINSCTHGGCHQTTDFHVEVQNIAYEKYVAIHLKNPKTDAWEDLQLSWRSTGAIDTSDSTKSTDVFVGSLDILSFVSGETGPVEYVVKYSVAGNTYWQKNATTSQNYVIPADFGAILANGQEIYAGDYQKVITKYLPTDNSTKENEYFQVYVKSKNADGQVYKAVSIRYSDNAWKTKADVRCAFSAYAYAGWYSGAQNPNIAGYEAWDCALPITVNATSLQYAALLKYEGSSTEIWDSNWGRNYNSALLWKRYPY